MSIVYQPRADLRSLWRQLMRYGRGRCRFVRKHPDAFSFAQIIPAAFVIWLVLGTLALAFPKVSLVFAASVAFYAIVVLCFSLGLGLRYGWRHFVFAPPIYATIHLALGCGFLAEAFHPGVANKRTTEVASLSAKGSSDQANSIAAARSMESSLEKKTVAD